MRCTYCSETYYGGLLPNYDIEKTILDFQKNKAFHPDLSIVWGGGEPTLLKNFDTLISSFTETLNPTRNIVFTNCTRVSPAVTRLLIKNKVNVVVSVDAGTKETFKKIRNSTAFDVVFRNIRSYSEKNSKNIIIKYILTDGNEKPTEIDSFVNKVVENKLTDCAFQISADFKNSSISDEGIFAAKRLHDSLRDAKAQVVTYDDHLQPRVNTKSHRKPSVYKQIIIWGAGQYARRMIETKPAILKEDIKFFVDNDKSKQGTKFFDLPVKDPKEISENKICHVYIASGLNYKDIYKELTEVLNFPKSRIIQNSSF